MGEPNTVVCICLDAKLAPSFFVILLIQSPRVISDVNLTRQCAIGVSIGPEHISTRLCTQTAMAGMGVQALHLNHADCRDPPGVWSRAVARTRRAGPQARSTLSE